MNPIIKNILAVIAGWFVGSIVNMGLIQIGHKLFPIEGIDPSNMDELANVMPVLGFEYFIFPFASIFELSNLFFISLNLSSCISS